MNLESLANELLLDLFEYFDTINQLIFVLLQRYSLDFRSISKCNFESFCRRYLPSINDRVISLHLSNDFETPDQLQTFLSNGYRINQFTHLKSLSIDYTDSFDLLDQITSQCRELSSLTHLSITMNNPRDPEEGFCNFINNIWSLSTLTHCYLDITFYYIHKLMTMSTISQSIRYLFVKNMFYDAASLSHLFKHTPHLQLLSMGKTGEFNDQPMQPIFPLLISLNAIVDQSILWMKNLFQKLPNLCYLTLHVNNIFYLYGNDWEKILTHYLKNIKVFRLKMRIEFSPSHDIEKQVDQLLDSFRSDFWIVKHQWFVQCDWHPHDVNKTGLLYTLPYAFDTFYYTDGKRSKSTSPNELTNSNHNRVQTLHHTDRKRDFNQISDPSPIRFVNLHHLTIKFPFHDNFWSIIPSLDRLISLDATLNQDFGYAQLQLLLDRALRLHSLRFCHMNKFSLETFNIKSQSIRRLEFFQNTQYDLRYFNANECVLLARSSIASQCQVLMIDIDNRTNILELFQTMPNLRVLHARCKNARNPNSELIETMDNFVQWLHDHLLFKFIYSIDQSSFHSLFVNVWIQKTSYKL
jgi:hypothetical protein